MEEKKIIIDQELSNYIESLQYDVEGLRQLMTQLHPAETSDDILEYWKNAYLAKFQEYTLAKNEIEKNIRESGVVENGKPFSWSLDFTTREVTIEQ